MLLSQPSYPSLNFVETAISASTLPPSSYPIHQWSNNEFQQHHHFHHHQHLQQQQQQQQAQAQYQQQYYNCYPPPSTALNNYQIIGHPQQHHHCQQQQQQQTEQSIINSSLSSSSTMVSNINEMFSLGNFTNSSSTSASTSESNCWVTAFNGITETTPASVSATTSSTPSATARASPPEYKLFEIKAEQMSPINSSSCHHSSNNSGPNSAPTVDSKEGILGSIGNPLSEPQRPQSDLNVYSKCTVCEDVADGYHFSALSCAACSAFFRRSIADQKTYACVTRNCNVSINSRKHGVICRYCRFQKCIFAGMCPDEVQGKRNKILPESPGRSSPASSVSAAPYPTITTLRRGGKGTRTSQARGPNVPLLNEMSGARRTLGNHRMMNINCPPTTNPSTPPTTISNPFTMLEKEFVLFKKFCEQVAMLNGIIADSDHWQFSTELQNLFLTWVIFESVHATIRFGGIQTNRAYSGDLSNIDIDESSLTAYLSDGNTRDAASMARFAYPVLQFFNMNLCRNVQNMRLDEKEAAALMSLLLINQVKSRPVEPFKHQIFKELGEHYRNYEVDASVRLANIVLIISTFDEALGKAKEFLTCWNLFSFKF